MSGISPQQKKDAKKKRGAWIEKQDMKPHLKSSMFQKKERMRFTSCCWERFYQNKQRKDITFSYSAKSDVWPHPYPHIICICTTFYSLTLPFPTPFHYTILRQP
jgi:hypothetical protein